MFNAVLLFISEISLTAITKPLAQKGTRGEMLILTSVKCERQEFLISKGCHIFNTDLPKLLPTGKGARALRILQGR
jgi:hypothetical protein